MEIVSGYALKFNTKSRNLGGFYEMISPKALDKVDLTDVKLLLNHKHDEVLGSTKNDTLELELRDDGLYFTALVDADIAQKVRDSKYDYCSFGFIEKRATKQNNIKTVLEIEELLEVSLVSIPAYKDTFVRAETGSQILTRSFTPNKTMNGEMDMNNTNELFYEVLQERSFTTANAEICGIALADVLDVKKGLQSKVNSVKTKAGSGVLPVLATNAVLPNVAELANAADLETLTAVKFEAKTFRGIIPVSQELIDDAGESIVNEIKKHIEQLKVNTVNSEIGKVAATATPQTGTLAELRTAAFAHGSTPTIVATKSALAKMIDQVDGANNYIYKDGQYAGFDVEIVADTVLGSDGDALVYIGDLTKMVVVERSDIELEWINHARFGRMLQPVLRFDVVNTDDEAVLFTIS